MLLSGLGDDDPTAYSSTYAPVSEDFGFETSPAADLAIDQSNILTSYPNAGPNPAGNTPSAVTPPLSQSGVKGRKKRPAPGDSTATVSSASTVGGGKTIGDSIFGIPLPSWLPAWAAIGGLAVLGGIFLYYGQKGGGRRKKRGGRRVARNPKGEADDDLVGKARNFGTDFHWGIKGRKTSRRNVSDAPRVLTELGTLATVTYKTKKRGESAHFFEHDFKGRRPKLAMDIENKRLHIVGGSYSVTADGIVG